MNLSAAETVIKKHSAKVSIPDRFVFERKTVSDEGDLSGVLRDKRTDTTIQYEIDHSWGFKGLHPSKLDWSKVVYFERSPDGWYDQQFFVFDKDQELQVEARYGFQGCVFTVKIPKNGDYRKCIEVLRLIKVALNDGWILTRGESFDEFTVKPLK